MLLGIVFLLAGCFGSSWIITLKSDGSGRIEMEYHLDGEIIAMMQSMGGGEGEMATTSAELIEQDSLNEMAAMMGEGVRLVSATPYPEGGSSIGYSAVFEFDDINGLRIDPMEGAPQPEEEPGGEESPFTFQFKPGRTAELVILMDQDDEGDAGEDSEYDDEAEFEEAPAGDDDAMTEMMKPYFSSMSFLVKVVFEGNIQETNASYREGNSVTLLDMNMGKIIDNDELFKGVMDSGNKQDEEMTAALEAAGIRIETQERVSVKFR